MKTKDERWMESMYGNTLNSRMALSHDYKSYPFGHYRVHSGAAMHGINSLKFFDYKDMRRDRRRGITLLLLLGAFFISFCVAVIVFFVVMNDAKDPKFEYHVANVSMPLWNTTWNDDMDNVTSEHFIDIAVPFCSEIDSYFEEGLYSDYYKGCSVKKLMWYNTTDCECSGILGNTTGQPVVLLTFDLLFRNKLTEYEIMSSILSQARAKYSRGYRLLFVGDFLVDITGHSVITPSPLKPGVVEGTYVHARYGLYSFNYTDDLKEVRSPRFETLQMGFCTNLIKFLEYSIISENLEECGILTFRELPVETDFYLTFALPRGSYIINNITWVLSNIAPGMTVDGLELAFVGDLNLILSQSVITISKVNITTGITTSQPQTTVTSSLSSPTTVSTTTPPTTTTTTQATTESTMTTPTTKSTTTSSTTTPTTTTTTLSTTETSTTAPPTTATPITSSSTASTTMTTKSTTTASTTTAQTSTTQTTTTDAPLTCSDQPCQNNGFCRELQTGGFICQCSQGFTGDLCESDINECLTSPCQNGGSCTNSLGSYTCDCGSMWTGQHCTDSLRECDSRPCQNNGSCIATPGSYMCVCLSGWTGTQCQTDINECNQVDCSNHGNCRNTDGSFYCQCDRGWTGPLCSSRIDECANNPCANGGTCFNGQNSYFCTCNVGWTGVNCEVDINECNIQIEPCLNGGSCRNNNGSYACDCPSGWRGTYCEQNVDECQTGVCDHAASCVDSDGSYTCICTSGWTGQNCSDDINECRLGMTMCMYGGTCVNINGGYTCTCPPGRTGLVCSEDVNECTLGVDNCMSGSTCMNSQGSYTCLCPPGITGQFCTENIDECQQLPCKNGGTCIDNRGSYTCSCTVEWTGHDCTQVVNECSSDPCKNGATCVTQPGTYQCLCDSGWMGDNCDTDINECQMSPCQNGGSCSNQDGTYQCTCLPQNSGQNCEETIYACISGPCKNNATCLDSSSGGFTCMCNDGWSGPTCSQNVNECLTSPCDNGGNCVDTPGSFYCQCATGLTGQYCQDDIKECDTDPCHNGAVCVETTGSFYCNCAAGWVGSLCTDDVDECLTSPCDNGGNCVDTPGSFYCQCAAGFTGQYCQDDIKECDTDPCHNGAVCVETTGSFYCNCSAGWVGSLCTDDVNECSNVPCDNNGGCINSLGSYTCVCTTGWTGPNCSIDVKECDTDPCFNGGVCSEVSGSFACDCPVGWTGSLCTDDVNECNTVPCNHNGGCVNTPGSYSCVCSSGWTGKNCSTDVNECNSLPCGPGSCRNTNGSFICDCPVGRTGPTCDQVLRTTFVFFLPVLNRTFTADLSNNTSQEFVTLATSFCNEVEAVLRGHQQFPHFFGCDVANFRNNPFIMNVELTFDGNETISTLQAARTELLDDKPLLYSGRFGVTLGDLVVEVQNYNATRKTWYGHLVNLVFTSNLLDPESTSYRTVDLRMCSDITQLMNASPFAQNYIGCLVENIQNATNLSSSSLATLAIYMDGGFNVASLQNSLSDFLSSKRPLVRFGDYMGHNLGGYTVYFSNYTGYIDVPLTLQVINQLWNPDLADPQSEAYKQLANPLCTAITSIVTADSTLAGDFKECMDVRFSELPPVVEFSLRFDSENMTYNVTSLDFYSLIKGGTALSVFYDYYSRTLGPLLVFHTSWGMISFDAVLLDTDFEFFNTGPNLTLWKDFELLFCKDIDDFISAASALNDRYYGCKLQPVNVMQPRNFTLRIVFNGTDDVTQQDIITAISNQAGNNVFGDKVVWEIGRELVYLAEDGMGQPVNISDFTTPAPVGIVFTEFVVTFQARNMTYTAALADRTTTEFSSLAVPLVTELNTLYSGKSYMDDFLSSILLQFRETPDEVVVTLIFDGPQISTLEKNIKDVLQEYARRASDGSQPAFMIGTLLLDKDNVTIERSVVTAANTTTSPTTVSTTTPTTTTSMTTTTLSTTTVITSVPCEGVTSFGEVLLPFPNNCRKYYMCFISTPIEGNCQVGEAFDPTISSCASDPTCTD